MSHNKDIRKRDFSSDENEYRKVNYPQRKLNPEDIHLPDGYNIEVFASGLNTPINLIITENNEMFLADSGVNTGNGKVLKFTQGSFKVIADEFNPPVTGINYYNGNIYVSHRGYITIIKPNGTKENIISGLPSFGDHHNNQVIFGPDGKMYFGQGTATNSGVVGVDNSEWVKTCPYFHDYPGGPIILNGQNFHTKNVLVPQDKKTVVTGGFSPYGGASIKGEYINGIIPASGSILRANPDGSDLEMIAWGLRNPFRMKFDSNNHLFCGNHGADVRGSRPIDKCPDEFQLITPGTWYGWPDYSGGLPVTLPMFKPEGQPQPTFLLASHPMRPPIPYALFPNHAAIMGFDFNYSSNFDGLEDVYIAEFGSEAPETTGGKPLPSVGHRVSRLNMKTRMISTFAINKSGYAASYTNEGGFERPIDVIFDKKGSMYVVDFGMSSQNDPSEFMPNTGVIWKITGYKPKSSDS